MPSSSKSSAPSTPNRVAARAALATKVWGAMGTGSVVTCTVAGQTQKVRGKVAMFSTDHKPQRAEQDGGSNLLITFEHGRTIPLEHVMEIEVEHG